MLQFVITHDVITENLEKGRTIDACSPFILSYFHTLENSYNKFIYLWFYFLDNLHSYEHQTFALV